MTGTGIDGRASTQLVSGFLLRADSHKQAGHRMEGRLARHMKG